jgi:K+-sensing histidine kinase KdpD
MQRKEQLPAEQTQEVLSAELLATISHEFRSPLTTIIGIGYVLSAPE